MDRCYSGEGGHVTVGKVGRCYSGEGGQMLQWGRWTDVTVGKVDRCYSGKGGHVTVGKVDRCYSGEGGQMLQWGRWTDVTVGKVDRCYSGKGGQMLQWGRWTDVTVGLWWIKGNSFKRFLLVWSPVMAHGGTIVVSFHFTIKLPSTLLSVTHHLLPETFLLFSFVYII